MTQIKITKREDGNFDGEFFGVNSKMPKAVLEYSPAVGGFVGVGQPANGRYLKPQAALDQLAVMMNFGQEGMLINVTVIKP